MFLFLIILGAGTLFLGFFALIYSEPPQAFPFFIVATLFFAFSGLAGDKPSKPLPGKSDKVVVLTSKDGLMVLRLDSTNTLKSGDSITIKNGKRLIPARVINNLRVGEASWVQNN